ncbi:MAG: response regulator [Bacteroidales bacterium]
MKSALVVDDNEINRILVSRFLTKMGWQVANAEDGDKALEWMAGNAADLILLDISMPTICGQEVCRRALAEGLVKGAKLVAYTAHAMPEEREEFVACGFDAILVKPVSRQTVADLLTELGLGEGGAA